MHNMGTSHVVNSSDGDVTNGSVKGLKRGQNLRMVTRRQYNRTAAAPVVKPTISTIPSGDLPGLIDRYIGECRRLRHSAATLAKKRVMLSNLLWLAQRERWVSIGNPQTERFFDYLENGHTDLGGRWGNPQQTSPTKPSTAKTYHAVLRSFFNALIADDVLQVSPLEGIKSPVVRADQIKPFTNDEIAALLAAAARSMYPERDQAILLLLLNTGIRASELCALTNEDVDFKGLRVFIRHGKGGKTRTVPMSRSVANAIIALQNEMGEIEPKLSLFISEHYRDSREAFDRHGLKKLFQRLQVRAKISSGVRCSPHTCRHTFAITYLRPTERGGYGGNVLELQLIMGHEDVNVLRRYVLLAEADIASRHHSFDILKSIKARR